MNNTINNNNTTKNLNIHIYYDIHYPKLSIININLRSFNHNIESLVLFIE